MKIIKFKIKFPLWSYGINIERLPHGLHVVIQFGKSTHFVIIGNYKSHDGVLSDLAFAGKEYDGLNKKLGVD